MAAELIHLAKRFFGALSPAPPPAAEVAWALSHLSRGERDLWHRMSRPDQRHAIQVARDVETELGVSATTPVMVAALLHDVGKVVSDFGTLARVGATMFWAVVPDERAEGFGRLGQYRRHPELGEQLLMEAGADPIASSWAADHHKSSSAWRVDPAIAEVLKACDDD